MTIGQLCLAGFVVLGAAACSDKATAAIESEDITPVAKAITIYSAGGSVVSGVIDSTAAGRGRLRVPGTIAAINLSQNDKNLKWFTVQAIEAKKDPKDATTTRDTKEVAYKLVGLPELGPGELKFNYALPDITWTLGLKAEIDSPKSVNLQLLAMINMNASEPYKQCDVTLVLNNAVSVEKLSASTFKLSSFDLYPHRDVTYSLDEKALDYSFVREWNAVSDKDEVHVMLQVKNPFAVDLNQISSSVEANKIIVESGTVSGQTGPGTVISLPAGIDDTISTFRTFKITEATDKRPLPFNHHITYEIVNRSDQQKTLKVVTSRVLGNEHRSVYHYKQPPDATPDDTLVWMLQLEPNSTRTLEFDFDADVKDVEGENGFEQGG
nr:hypothetical protein [Kofleriaceae bacterium]